MALFCLLSQTQNNVYRLLGPKLVRNFVPQILLILFLQTNIPPGTRGSRLWEVGVMSQTE